LFQGSPASAADTAAAAAGALQQVSVAPRIPSTTAAGTSARRSMATAATKDRAKGAVVGALVADAATMGLHCELCRD
jgi:hypothetical protein